MITLPCPYQDCGYERDLPNPFDTLVDQYQQPLYCARCGRRMHLTFDETDEGGYFTLETSS